MAAVLAVVGLLAGQCSSSWTVTVESVFYTESCTGVAQLLEA